MRLAGLTLKSSLGHMQQASYQLAPSQALTLLSLEQLLLTLESQASAVGSSPKGHDCTGFPHAPHRIPSPCPLVSNTVHTFLTASHTMSCQGLCHLPQCHPRAGPVPGRLTVCAQGLHGSTGQDLLTKGLYSPKASCASSLWLHDSLLRPVSDCPACVL